MSVSFTIDGLGTVKVSGQDLELLVRASPQLRELVQESKTRPIKLSPSEEDNVNGESIRYLLENIGQENAPDKQGIEEQRREPGSLSIVDLSQFCNTLHYYRCDPSPFLGLWNRLSQPWEVTPLPDDTWVWRTPRRTDVSQSKWPDYVNAAWILGKDDELSDVLRSVVWDSTFGDTEPALSRSQNIKSKQEF